ncbi:acyloxyacyl hydrolase isoform X2 [Rhinatrema bivittatum]|uniref:acyloxyacyl hydrolase isoform X2 n=1 Tax=Rhinatrema bivittatum TaxID=194408 RepID=UPI00112AC0F8|nr:acyloxyacyl hydrolase isoform X2 [Rhinatrema bivittatum]
MRVSAAPRCALLLLLLPLRLSVSSSPFLSDGGAQDAPGYLPRGVNGGFSCVEKLYLKEICHTVMEFFGPDLIKLLNHKVNADVVCHALNLCTKEPGLPYCHAYHPPEEGLEASVRKAQRRLRLRNLEAYSFCSLPFLRKICQKIEYATDYNVPLEDFDRDNFSFVPSFRGYDWRGKDCNDLNSSVYPGRRPHDWDMKQDSNCNGIWGVDPEDGIAYEKKFCEGTESKGIILLGDSAGAHFHIPDEWLMAEKMSLKAFSNLPLALSNELDWPQFSGNTGFLNSSTGYFTDSTYLRLRDRNHCNHRDYQSISKNGGSSRNLLTFVESLARKKRLDKPAIVIYSMIGNDVCNGYTDTLAHMTTPEDMHSNVMQALRYLNSRLPEGSHVILQGLVDGRFLWEHLHSRYHPIGQLNKDMTYEQLYTFLNCLQVSPCNGWMSTNKTLRDLTSQRASELSDVLKKIAMHKKFSSFDIFYVDFPLAKVNDEWHKMGGKPWQLVEPVDGFHPSQPALAIGAKIVWEEVLQNWPHVFGKQNPFNKDIVNIFGDQGGHCLLKLESVPSSV